MKKPLVIGNWKLNGNKKFIESFTNDLKNRIDNSNIYNVAIAPPFVYLNLLKQCLIKKNIPIKLAAQNVDIHESGPFTGEISANMLKDIGVEYVIIGHSERRNFHKETNIVIAEKFKKLKSVDLIPILCIGEKKYTKQISQTKIVCSKQIDVILNTLGVKAFENSIIAYEPVWAIGSGKTASPVFVQLVHEFIRKYIAKFDEKIANTITIQYGGSVNSFNSNELLSYPDIDGLLVGNSSLEANSFIKIITSNKIPQ